MLKNVFISIFAKISTAISTYWHHFYFHWQLKDKTAYFIITAIIIVIIAIPSLTYQLVLTKTITRNIKCLALNIYHEARGEDKHGQMAVAKVTLNRVASKRYPNTVCEVVYEKRWDRIRKRYVGAFSWTELDAPAKLKSKAWFLAWQIAKTVYHDKSKKRLKGALFYHAKYIKPSWARKKKPVAKIGKHIFYR